MSILQFTDELFISKSKLSLPSTAIEMSFTSQGLESTHGASMTSAPVTLYAEESGCFEVVPNKKVVRKVEEKCPSLHLSLSHLQWLLPVLSLDLASGSPLIMEWSYSRNPVIPSAKAESQAGPSFGRYTKN